MLCFTVHKATDTASGQLTRRLAGMEHTLPCAVRQDAMGTGAGCCALLSRRVVG